MSFPNAISMVAPSTALTILNFLRQSRVYGGRLGHENRPDHDRRTAIDRNLQQLLLRKECDKATVGRPERRVGLLSARYPSDLQGVQRAKPERRDTLRHRHDEHKRFKRGTASMAARFGEKCR